MESSPMLEYLFFSKAIALQFKQWLEAQGIDYTEGVEPIQEAPLIFIAEPDDDLWDKVDAFYDELAEEDQAQMERGEGNPDDKSKAGIYIQLSGDRQTVAQVDPELLNRILTVLSMDELSDFVDSIVTSVESPDDCAICK